MSTSTAFNNAVGSWFGANSGSPDVFRSTFAGSLNSTGCYNYAYATGWLVIGHQTPRTGIAMAGVHSHGYTGGSPSGREYIEVQLPTLNAGQTYYAEMYVSLAGNSPYAISNMGMHFSQSQVQSVTSQYLGLQPQVYSDTVILDSTNWVKISGTFVAPTDLNYLTIGNMFHDSLTTSVLNNSNTLGSWLQHQNAYYFVDDVLVRELCFNVCADTSICIGDSTTLTNDSGSFIGWADESQPNVILSTLNDFTVSPSVTTNYIAYTSCDTAVVTVNVFNATQVNVDLGSDTTLCQGQTLLLDASNLSANYTWQDNSTDSTFNVTQQGTYWVEASNVCGSDIDSIEVDYIPLPVVDFNDTVLCIGQTIVLDATNPVGTYEWQDGSTSPTYNVTQSGVYSVEVLNSCGIANDTIQVSYDNPIQLDLGNDTTLCQGQMLMIDALSSNADYLWQDNSTGSSFSVTQQGVYWVEVSNACGIESDSLQVDYVMQPAVNLEDTVLCVGQSVLLDVTNAVGTYTWQDGSSNPTLIVTQSGIYSVEVENMCGIATDTLVVDFDAPIQIDLGADTTLCEGQSAILVPGNQGLNYLWQDGSIGNSYEVNQSGIYTVEATNACGTAFDSIQVNYVLLPYIDLGEDTTICIGNSITLSGASDLGIYNWSNGSSEPSISVDNPGLYSVYVSNLCGVAEDEIQISKEECYCIVYLPNTITPNGDEVNQTLQASFDCSLTRYELYIYNRWGEQVFVSNNPNEEWDATYKGMQVQDGVYAYVLIYESEDEIVEIVHGHINVIR